MSAIELILNILMVISALIMIVTVLLQSSDDDGMSALTGGSDTFFGKNRNNTLEGKLAMGTKVSATVFVILAIVMLFVSKSAG